MKTVRKRRSPFHEQHHCDPFLAPDWRWRRAIWHVDTGHRYSRARDDAATGRAVSFVRGWRRCRTRRQFSGLRRRAPALFAAHEIFRSEGRPRLELEARLLAGQSFAEITARLALPQNVIEAYEQTFHAVSDRLAARGWITRLLGAHRHGGEEFASVVKSFAYSRGPHMLEALLANIVDANGRFTLEKTRDWSTKEGRLAARLAILVIARRSSSKPALTDELCRASELISRLEQIQAPKKSINQDFAMFLERFTLPPPPSTDATRSNPTSGASNPSSPRPTELEVNKVA